MISQNPTLRKFEVACEVAAAYKITVAINLLFFISLQFTAWIDL